MAALLRGALWWQWLKRRSHFSLLPAEGRKEGVPGGKPSGTCSGFPQGIHQTYPSPLCGVGSPGGLSQEVESPHTIALAWGFPTAHASVCNLPGMPGASASCIQWSGGCRSTSCKGSQAQDQSRLKPLHSMAASRSLSSSFSRSRCSSNRATRESRCSTTSSISFRIFFSSDSSSSVFR